MRTCVEAHAPVHISERLIGWNDEDYIVVEIEQIHALARLIDVRTAASTVYSFRDLAQLIEAGELKIAARQQSSTPDNLHFSSCLDRRAYYCNAVDAADARFLLSEPEIERVVQDAAAKVGERPPSAATVLTWWRRWVLNDRADDTFTATRAA